MIQFNGHKWYLLYQPQYLKGSVVGYEALLRVEGNVTAFPRDLFYGMSRAEQQELTLLIAKKVDDRIECDPDHPISFNVSPEIFDRAFVDHMIEVASTCPTGYLRVELIEDVELIPAQAQYVQVLAEAGIGIVIDDIPDKYSLQNLEIAESLGIPLTLKVEMTQATPELMQTLRAKNFTIIQEGEAADMNSGDIVQTRKISR
jgi:EAL domain-containing protein (putative c-di-GMP-specific phosphodiesterase class I)